jgi:hypothetical protein
MRVLVSYGIRERHPRFVRNVRQVPREIDHPGAISTSGVMPYSLKNVTSLTSAFLVGNTKLYSVQIDAVSQQTYFGKLMSD